MSDADDETIRRIRNRLGLSQKALAELIGASQSQISRLEKGGGDKRGRRLTKEWAQRLAHVLQRPAQRLLFPEGGVAIGFDDRLLRLSKATWLSSDEFDRIIQLIDLVIVSAETKEPKSN